MKLPISFLPLFAAAALTAAGAPRAATTNAPPARNSFEAFRIIVDRNIFSPTRTPGTSASAAMAAPAVHGETFALVGTMSYEKGAYAFFDSADSRLRKTVQPDQTIAGFKVTVITYDGVKLQSAQETNSPPVSLAVGMEMKRVDQGPWRLGGRSELFSKPTAATESAPASSDGAEDPIIKRLMERRAQELKK